MDRDTNSAGGCLVPIAILGFVVFAAYAVLKVVFFCKDMVERSWTIAMIFETLAAGTVVCVLGPAIIAVMLWAMQDWNLWEANNG